MGFGNEFLDKSPKDQWTKEKNKFYKIEFIQIQNFKDQRMLLRRWKNTYIW